jgi:hypothetical protein
LTFLHPIFFVQDHILSTAGDAVRHIHTYFATFQPKISFEPNTKIRLAWKFQKGPNARTSYQCFKNKSNSNTRLVWVLKKLQYQHQAGMFQSR